MRIRPFPRCNSDQEAATQLTTTWELNEGGSANIPAGRPNLGVDLNKKNSDLSYPLWATKGSYRSLLF